ncbi:MAG: Asp23/Gls24 family envelope stress response protein [Actinomycetaceae bacterium]|nr:Asp23/Gls24 family envelope stress response protein [Actinomycetaceae bacterium]
MTERLECGMLKTSLMSYANSTETEPLPEYDTIHTHVQRCATCQNALAEYKNLSKWALALREDTLTAPRDEDLANSLLSRVQLPWKEGRPIAVASEHGNDLAVSEMLLRRTTRARCTDRDIMILGIKVTDSKPALEIDVDIAVRYGRRIPDAVSAARGCISRVWIEQTGREVAAVNVSVLDLFEEGAK